MSILYFFQSINIENKFKLKNEISRKYFKTGQISIG